LSDGVIRILLQTSTRLDSWLTLRTNGEGLWSRALTLGFQQVYGFPS